MKEDYYIVGLMKIFRINNIILFYVPIFITFRSIYRKNINSSIYFFQEIAKPRYTRKLPGTSRNSYI